LKPRHASTCFILNDQPHQIYRKKLSTKSTHYHKNDIRETKDKCLIDQTIP